MELVLGVSVSGTRADLALLDALNPATVLDQFFLELSADPVGEVATTVIGTDRMLTDGGHRLLGTRVYWSGREFSALKEALDEAGLHDTALLPEFATARDAASAAADRASDQSVTARNNTGMADLGPEMASSTGPFAPTALSPQLGPHLAYSQATDSSRSIPLLPGADYSDHPLPLQSAMSPLSRIGQYDEESDEPLGRPRVLLLGSAAAAVVVVGFSALAVTVAIGIRPTAAEKPVPVPNTATENKVYPIPGDDVWRPNPSGVPVGPNPDLSLIQI
ncbi:hypothetical protein [Mycolicibacterium vinylchloridicum]|uniref:hypothetical protein n=1 Tax=Mycolicibacterium vinylchloridicum TaxID=2736928 RepID=UPI0015CDC11D|nr:hypothetical protein [Mycolicibacterium vinylchloridicum]